jgi:adenine-specific DNA-methyltransferase
MRVGSGKECGHRSELGQFFTPVATAEFMASLFTPLPAETWLLDAGAGEGALSLALVREICQNHPQVRTLVLVAYELDLGVLPALRSTLAECDKLCRSAGITFSSEVVDRNFIEHSREVLDGGFFAEDGPRFHAAIVNPPYRKIATNSRERCDLSAVGIETSNLYTGFLALIAKRLLTHGQLVAITPRSFCNGPYFKPFRMQFLETMALTRIHVFDSRRETFKEDRVLQETVIIHAVRGLQGSAIHVTSSPGVDGASMVHTDVPFAEIVNPRDPHRFIHIPSRSQHLAAKHRVSSLPATLDQLGLSVSTGRVVDFRLRASIRKDPEAGAVPLVYASHFNGGTVHWPRPGGKKPNAILVNDETRKWLVPAGRYVLTKRFTSKEERRRLVASVFDPSEVPGDLVGFENHLNYFHAEGGGLDRDLALGLFAYLNGTLVDDYFRSFSGHTQVNATDLRKLHYPDRPTLREIGADMARLDLEQAEIDTLLERHIHD